MERTIVSSEIPADLVQRLDVHLAKIRLQLVERGVDASTAPTRSSFIRDAIIQKLNGSSVKK